jgi:hypothetical protein
MECERACSGDVIHCPGCGAQIRVPFHHPAELDGAVSRAELVASAPPTAAGQDAPAVATTHDSEKREATVNCPACHAELKIVIPAHSQSASTTLLHAPVTPAHAPASASRASAESEHPDFAHMSLREREKQIARAREAHPIQVNTNPKPRLEYVLEGKAPPPATHE